MHRNLLCLAVLVSLNLQQTGSSPAAEPDAEAKATVDEYWDRIRNAGMAEAPQESVSEQELTVYWADVYKLCFDNYEALITQAEAKGNMRAVIKEVVDKFGSSGAQADMRWLLSEPGSTMNLGSYIGLPPSARQTERERLFRSAQLLMAEFQVRQFLKQPKLLERYYRAVVWSQYTFHGSWFKAHCKFARHHFERDSVDYWWYARDFIVLAYGTGREDLLENVKPDELHAKFAEWDRWIKVMGAQLRPVEEEHRWRRDEQAFPRFQFYKDFELPPLEELPKTPFPEWKGTPPLSQRVLWELS